MGIETAIIAGGLGLAAMGATSIVKAARGSDKGGGGMPQMPKTPEAPTKKSAAEKAEDIARRRKAQATKTVFSNPLGQSTSGQITKKTLLGQ